MKLAHRLENWLTKVWYENQNPGFFAGVTLNILMWVYAAIRWGTRQDIKTQAARTEGFPTVLVVGNLIAGGAGKTPIVQAVCTTMRARGHQVGILTRGYKRHSKIPLVIDPNDAIDAKQCGDEPAWLHLHTSCPISIGANRSLALKRLLDLHPELDLIVSDDGLQHHHLHRHLEWVVFDERAAGNKKLLPAGPLREPLNRLESVDAIISSVAQPEDLAIKLGMTDSSRMHFTSLRIMGFEQASSGHFMDLQSAIQHWAGKNILAFTGLANPNKFFAALVQSGIDLVVTKPLPDHFDYPQDFCADLACDVALTTGKDAVKLVDHLEKVWVARIHVDLPDSLISQIEAKIGLTHR